MRTKIKTNYTRLILILSLGTGSLAVSCQTVKPYQRSYLNDSAMKMGLTKASGIESYAQMIREGASGAGGKSGGGCGCN